MEFGDRGTTVVMVGAEGEGLQTRTNMINVNNYKILFQTLVCMHLYEMGMTSSNVVLY